ALEWFDFLVYGYFAVTISQVFFPSGNETASLLLALGTFSVSFLVRPIGAILIGAYTDRAGRKAGLTLSILLMVIGTTMTALMPGYATIGLAAPILILVARLIQGFSVGGEFGSAVTFLAEQTSSRKGFVASWQWASTGITRALASGFGNPADDHIVVGAACRLGLARPVPVRDLDRPGRALYSPPARRDAGICRDQADPHSCARRGARAPDRGPPGDGRRGHLEQLGLYHSLHSH